MALLHDQFGDGHLVCNLDSLATEVFDAWQRTRSLQDRPLPVERTFASQKEPSPLKWTLDCLVAIRIQLLAQHGHKW